jgi:hypothetical protein
MRASRRRGCVVERLLGRHGLRQVVPGERRRTTIPDGQAQRPRDLVDRDFTADLPSQSALGGRLHLLMSRPGVVSSRS